MMELLVQCNCFEPTEFIRYSHARVVLKLIF